jgi:hypothetical protein
MCRCNATLTGSCDAGSTGTTCRAGVCGYAGACNRCVARQVGLLLRVWWTQVLLQAAMIIFATAAKLSLGTAQQAQLLAALSA